MTDCPSERRRRRRGHQNSLALKLTLDVYRSQYNRVRRWFPLYRNTVHIDCSLNQTDLKVQWQWRTTPAFLKALTKLKNAPSFRRCELSSRLSSTQYLSSPSFPCNHDLKKPNLPRLPWWLIIHMLSPYRHKFMQFISRLVSPRWPTAAKD